MSNGVYGFKRGADVDLSDIEVFLHYTPSLTERVERITKLNTNEVILKNHNPNSNDSFEIMGGFYTLKLPSTIFNNKGFYSVIIKPIEIRTKIVDTGVLSAQPNIRGLILDTSNIDPVFLNKFQNNNLVGYRIEYLDNSTSGGDRKINNLELRKKYLVIRPYKTPQVFLHINSSPLQSIGLHHSDMGYSGNFHRLHEETLHALQQRFLPAFQDSLKQTPDKRWPDFSRLFWVSFLRFHQCKVPSICLFQGGTGKKLPFFLLEYSVSESQVL